MSPALVVAVTAISFAAIFFRLADHTHPLVASGVRLAASCVLLMPLALRAHLRRPVAPRQIGAAVLGGFAYALHFGAWVTSLTLTTVAASVTFVTATPLLLAALALVTRRDVPTRRHWLALGLASAGIALIGGHDLSVSRQALFGDGLALLGAGAMAAFLLNARRLGGELDLWVFACVATGVGALVLLTLAAALGLSFDLPTQDLVYVLLAALIPQMIGHNLLTWVLRHATPTAVGTAVLGEPVGATVIGYFALGESVAPIVVVGCVTTLVAVGLAVRAPVARR